MNKKIFVFQSRCLRIIVGAIAIGGFVSACGTTSPNSTSTNAAPTSQTMNHEGMNHGDMMNLGAADADYDLRFIDAMIPHHEGAVIMANAVIANSKRPELIKLANNIIEAQNQEIDRMKKWRQSWYPQAPKTPMAWHPQMNHMMPMSSEQLAAMRMDIDLGKGDSQFDLRFIDAMIPHHEGAVVMAKDLLQKSKRPDLQKLGKDIITSQQAEIEQMKQWRSQWYGK
jgi:uncharacterized protein (DUF305 family)